MEAGHVCEMLYPLQLLSGFQGQYPEVSVQGLGCSKHPAGVSVQELCCTRGQSVVRAQKSASGVGINTYGSLRLETS